MWKNYLLGLMVLFSLAACNSAVKSNSGELSGKMLKGAHFGEKITSEGSMTYDELMTSIDGKDSLEAKVVGTVAEVCQKKGCWMTILGKGDQPDMRVRFKDYGFFMPTDISGKKVVFAGKAFKETTSVGDLRHYAEDEGKSAEEIAAITEPLVETTFLAHGVILVKE